MGEVVAMEKKVPHLEGECYCVGCKHTWHGVVEVGADVFFECPQCSAMKGCFRNTVLKERAHWTCNCGNTLFHITPEGVYCPSCGGDQNFDNAK